MKIAKDSYENIFQLVSVQKHTLKEVAAQYGCTPGRISQIVTKLRKEKELAN